MYYELDNLGEVTAVDHYDGDGVSITSTSGVPNKPSSSLLRGYATASFDEQGRVYRTNVFEVNPSSGSISTYSLETDIWYDHRGDIIKTTEPGGLTTKNAYDGAGRVTATYQVDASSDTGWSNAGSVTGNAVLQETDYTLDADGNVTETTLRRRFDDQTGTGALGTPTSGVLARVSFEGFYYDKAERLVATVDVGTNGGSAWTMPSSVPSRSDTVLVTSQTYTAAGWVQDTTDPRGIVTRDIYDNLGRVTQTIEAYDGGSETASTNKTTDYSYDGSNHVITLTAELPGGGEQQTKFNYGVTTTGGSGITSNDVLASVDHPDPSTGTASSSQRDLYTVDALGEVVTYQDRDGNVHTYTLDVLGRETSDAITTLGTGVDGTVRRIDTAYDTQGNAFLFTSYDSASGGTALNQVENIYNGLDQLTAQWQEHSGTVTGSSLEVQYAYVEMSSGANNSRLTSVTYPNGKVLTYNYASGVDSDISRLTSLSDSTGTLEGYAYLGLNTVVLRSHSQPGVDLTYIKQTGEASGDAGDKYIGLDRFDRVVDQRWIKTSTGVATDRFQYLYDRDGNRLYKNNLVNSAFSELYHTNGANGYDNLNQIQAFAQGTLSASVSGGPLDTVATASASQSWSLDVMGNFASQTTNGTAVSRTHNKQNEITAVGSATLTYDANGSMTTDEQGRTLKYDAWNRLVQIKDSSGTTLATYTYDALGRRITITASSTTTDLYYSAAWQVLEERASGSWTAQYVWSPVYIDALILRDRPTERYWVQQDANWNVTAIVNTSGAVVERYVYYPYGGVALYDASWNLESSNTHAWTYLFQSGRYDWISEYSFRHRDFDAALGRWVESDPLGFAAGDTNLYRGEVNAPVNRIDPLGTIPDGEAGRIVIEILNGTRPRADLSQLSPQQMAAALARYERVIASPGGEFPPQLIRDFNQARLDYLRGIGGTAPGAIQLFAQEWLARQSPEWLRNNPQTVARILDNIRRWTDVTTRRAAQPTGRDAPPLPRGGNAFVLAIIAVFVDPTPTAGAPSLPRDTLTFPGHSPQLYYLPPGTFIMPNGLIYIPGPNQDFLPPPGSVVVTGRVCGQAILSPDSLRSILRSDQVIPFSTGGGGDY
jgi:RHS repeat-associated protein